MSDRLMQTIIWIALLFGLIYRVWPIVAGQPALSQYFITEDGYLMLTVARNLAIGLGLSVSDGTIATNGVQPLATFLYAVPYLVTGGDKVSSLAGILAISAVMAVAGIFAVRAFAQAVFEGQETPPWLPSLVATLWFVGPLLVHHSMNALETGLYSVVVVVALLQFGRLLTRGEAMTLSQRLLFGALCGVVFLARIDGALLVTAMFLVWFLREIMAKGRGLVATVRLLVPPGLMSLALASPWLLHNLIFFGSIMPISGTAQSLSAGFGQNLPLVPVKLAEHALPMLPLPGSLETNPVLIGGATVLLAVILPVFLFQTWRAHSLMRLPVIAYTLFGISLVLYYGLFFGAAHFLSRYFAPLAPLLILAAVSTVLGAARWLLQFRAEPVLQWTGAAALLLSVGLLGRLLLPGGHEQGHFQVVAWVQDNVAEDIWVGAVQTGTLGYWHDRTINLDGKVNPAALAARRETGNVLRYVVESDIDYLADWIGIAAWADDADGGFSDRFELIVADRQSNLAVLQRTR